MSFSAEHYIKVAKVIRELKPLSLSYTLKKEDVVAALVEMFEKDNPKFDYIEFVDACYSEE